MLRLNVAFLYSLFGIGNSSKHTEGISLVDENTLWETAVLNIDTLIGLFWSVFFFYNRNCFCPCGWEENRELTLAQVEKFELPLRYVYTEKSSKIAKEVCQV